MYPLQNFSWPNINLITDMNLYGRTNEFAHMSLDANGVSFAQQGELKLDTFFNSISINPWKKYCRVDDLYLTLQGHGKFILRIGLHRLNHAHTWLLEETIDLSNKNLIDLPFWKDLEDGILYCNIKALSDGELNGGGFATSTEPINDVKLGIVITHFNRKQYVIPALKRIRNELLLDKRYQEKIDLIVVDNSQNITQEESQGVTVISNLNLGGSGGFTRGLLHLKDSGTYTHCLFMDDDASCEIESIRRTYALLQYAHTEKFAVAGSLLREVKPYQLFEKGAQFNGVCKPLKSGLDMRSIKDLLKAEKENKKPDYGGWWFFAYKISDLTSFPFPFFVRGDDSLFSMMNKFTICTMNGIGTWGEDFTLKRNPMIIYLDTRYHLLHGLQFMEFSTLKTLSYTAKFFLVQLFSYEYSSARAATLALTHLLQGPIFWTNNLDTSNVRTQLNSFKPSENMENIDLTNYKFKKTKMSKNIFIRIFQLCTLNGFLLPSFCLKNEIAYAEKSKSGRFRKIYGYKKVLYYYKATKKGYIAEHNKTLFYKELFSFAWQAAKFIFKFQKLRKEYQQSLSYLTSEKFWREVYKDIK
jgi:GT2 family glycosyltransferase